MNALASRFLRDDAGATMVEYAVMLALIAAVCITAIAALGGTTQALYSTLSSAWNAPG
ncbi:MAG TPA: Flp family type IVb pilin [Candidatus Baltobacteraceae bacterium]|nr:Flp family type IVb pilin [Candidatus Baltobacteraceae bacterium]